MEYLPKHSDGAFSDPRLNLVIDDGAHFVANNHNLDVIITDSTDPIGPRKFFSNRTFTKGVRDIDGNWNFDHTKWRVLHAG